MSSYGSDDRGSGCAGCVVFILVIGVPILGFAFLPWHTPLSWLQSLGLAIGFAVFAHAALSFFVECTGGIAMLASSGVSTQRRVVGGCLLLLHIVLSIALFGVFIAAMILLETAWVRLLALLGILIGAQVLRFISRAAVWSVLLP